MSVEHVPGHQERMERLRATSPHTGALRSTPPVAVEATSCALGRTEHCWHQGPFISSADKGWQGEQCCFCPAHRQEEFILVPPEGHGKGVPPHDYVWRKKEAK